MAGLPRLSRGNATTGMTESRRCCEHGNVNFHVQQQQHSRTFHTRTIQARGDASRHGVKTCVISNLDFQKGSLVMPLVRPSVRRRS